VAQKAAAAAAGSDLAADVERHQQQLLEALAAIDQLGAQQVRVSSYMCKQYGKKGVRAVLAGLLRLSPLHSVMSHFRRIDWMEGVIRQCFIGAVFLAGEAHVYIMAEGLPPVDAIGDCVWLCMQLVLDDASSQLRV
jgi:hypothetical protein